LIESYPIGLRWPHSLRQPLERAAADHGLSVADFVEAAVLQAMVSAGVIQIEKQKAKWRKPNLPPISVPGSKNRR
jgi:uncharacterized protein (DUF1778 family)